MQVRWGVAPRAPVARWFVGIDWASETHQVCLVDAGGKIVGERGFPHGGAGLAEMCIWLLVTTRAEPTVIAVAIEVPHGPIVETLLERGFLVYAINPTQLDRFRDRFTVAGANDDRRDAHVLGDSLRTDRHCFRHLTAEDAVIVELREWSRMAVDLQQEHNRLANRVREQLWRYYPQALKISDDLGADWFLELWAAVPTPAKAARVRESSIDRVLKTHRIRRIAAAEAAQILRQQPLIVAAGTVEAASAHIRAVAARLKLVNRQVKQAHRCLDALCGKLAAGEEKTASGQEPEQRDVTILRSLPGVGRIVLATLLAEAGEPVPSARLSRAANPLRGRPSDQAQWQALHRHQAPSLPYATAQRGLSLGPGCYPTRSAQPLSLCRIPQTRPQPRARPAQRCRPAARGGLRNARPADHV
jgi:hypothetical protein